jgi:hypothetical protein
MSPSFRNLFSSDDGNARSSADSGLPGGAPAAKGQVFLISEILPYIPPAIVARSGIPMELSVSVPLPENGSREVRLSVLHHLCPSLFATEITPTNDLVITLPPRIGVKAETEFSQVVLRERPLFQKKPGPPSKSATATGPAANPFRPRRSETGAGIPGGGTLFIRKAAEDADLPLPKAPVSSDGEQPATWGSLFLDKVKEPAVKTEMPPESPAVEIIETPALAALPGTIETAPLAPVVAKTESPALVPLEEKAATSLPSAIMPEPERLPLAPVAVNAAIPPLTPERIHPPLAVSPDPAKVPSHVFEHLDEDEDPAVSPAAAFVPNPWAAVEALRPVKRTGTGATEATPSRSGQVSKPCERSLIFRAIFGTEDDFDLDRLAQALLIQTGIDSVVLSLPPRLTEASLDSVEKLGDKALELIETTRSLGRLVGVDNDSFSFQADRGFISLFTHGQQAIVVRHAEARLSPGLRERLLISVRNLESLAG